MTVTDPITGQPVQQVVQTIIDPSTGETSQILINPNSNLGISSYKFHGVSVWSVLFLKGIHVDFSS